MFRYKKFLKFFFNTNFWTQKCFEHNIFLDQKFFWPKMCKTHINFLKIQQKNFWTENILSQNIFYQQMLDNKFCITKRTLDPFVFRSQIIFGGSNSFLDRKLFGIKFFGTEFFEPRYFGHLSFGTKIVFGIKRSNFFLDFLNLNIYNVGSKNSVNFR